MSDPKVYFHLHSKTMHPCSDTKKAYAEALQTWLCAGCARPKPDVQAVDVWLQNRAPRDKPLNFVFGSAVGLIHKDLLEAIGATIVEQDLYLGQVIGDCGRLEDWATFRGRRGVIVRGSKDASFRTCPECGRNIYCASGKRYLYPTPPRDATIFESDLFGLVVPPDVYKRVSKRNWRMLAVDSLPVLAEPADGLGELPFR